MTLEGRVHFAVRSLHSPSGLDAAFRVHILPEHLEQTNLKVGEICEITSGEDSTTILGYGISWRATDRMGTNPKQRPAKMSDVLRRAYNIDEGSHVWIKKAENVQLVHADEIVLADVTPTEYLDGTVAEIEDNCWWWRSGLSLSTCEAFANGTTFEVPARKGIRKRFHIENVEATGLQQGMPALFCADDHTKLLFHDSAAQITGTITNGETANSLSEAKIGGLVEQIHTLNVRMKDFLHSTKASRVEQPLDTAVLIHGYEGTGKSLLLDEVDRAAHHFGFRKVVRLDATLLESGTTAKIRDTIESTIKEAHGTQPSIVIIDQLDCLAPAAGNQYGSTICKAMKELQASQVFVIAACQNVLDVRRDLLKPNMFSELVELPIPDAEARQHILHVLLSNGQCVDGDVEKTVGLRTHGFTGEDLSHLIQHARRHSRSRTRSQREEILSSNGSFDKLLDGASYKEGSAQLDVDQATLSEYNSVRSMNIDLTMEDFDYALQQVKPTALRELFFEKPQVQWSDIGGSQAIKKRFDNIINLPPDLVKRLRLRPTKGVLLYGPPGCSKTLTAQAVATNYDWNFIAVQGAELISMYVGESERAVREIFRKARAAAPCVVFFDEIDSIASERESAGTKGLNVLTTLLNEMDGFQPLKNVLVLAATNKPQVLDPAIMRPGRFDAHIYLGPPNEQARKEILRMATKDVLDVAVDGDAFARATEGYTGAEIVGMCQLAGNAAALRETDKKDHLSVMILKEDLELGLSETKKGVTEEMLQSYRDFGKK